MNLAILEDIRNLAREHATTAIQALVEIVERGRPDAARVSAASELLSRGYGRPMQPLVGDENAPPIGLAVDDLEERRRRVAKWLGEAPGAPVK